MSSSRSTRVYILGAGCSAKYGIPVAKHFVNNLQDYSATLGCDSQKIWHCATDTIQAMRDKAASLETVDELVARTESRLRSQSSTSLGYTPEKESLENDTTARILKAKWATVALLLSQEEAALASGLRGYHDLMHEIFPSGHPLDERLENPSSHVLTFNYDRLFEIAFLKHFGLDPLKCNPYGQSLLNTGLSQSEVTFNPKDHFSLLKLHGSVGIRQRGRNGSFQHCNCPQLLDFNTKLDDKILFGEDFELGHNPQWQPLLAFPHEKHLNEDYAYPFKRYLHTIWERAQQIIAQAVQVWVIGYSFSAIDLDYNMRELFMRAKACKEFVIHNPDAPRLCTMLQHKHPEFEQRLIPYTAEF